MPKFFFQSGSTQDEIARAGELSLLKLYKAPLSKTLGKLRFLMYCRSVKNIFDIIYFQAEITPIYFCGCQIPQLQSMPGYSAVARTLNATNSVHGGTTGSNRDDRPVSYEKVLKRRSCGCKGGYGKQCTCTGLVWSVTCVAFLMATRAKTLKL